MYGYKKVNVADQRRDPESMLNWTERMIRARKECPEISWGNFVVLRTNVPEVLAIRYDWRNTSLLTLHNFSSAKQTVKVKVDAPNDGLLVEVFDGHHSKAHNDGVHRLAMDGARLAVVSRRRAGQRARAVGPGSDQPSPMTWLM